LNSLNSRRRDLEAEHGGACFRRVVGIFLDHGAAGASEASRNAFNGEPAVPCVGPLRASPRPRAATLCVMMAPTFMLDYYRRRFSP